jgi:hypothetical protein
MSLKLGGGLADEAGLGFLAGHALDRSAARDLVAYLLCL